jgi:LemA protein
MSGGGLQMEQYLVITLVLGGAATACGIACLVIARIKDQENYIIQKATPLPLAMVNERDDVWLKGIAECDAPVTGPHFGIPCLHYNYKLEERVTKRSTDSKGRRTTSTRWVTRQRDSDSAVFRLSDANGSILINGNDADFRHLTKEQDRRGNWRHTLHYFPYPSGVNAVGSVSEGKERLEKYANIPLVVTCLDRAAFVSDAEKKEKWLRGGGFFLLWTGMTGLFYFLWDWRSLPVATDGQFSPKTLIAALLPSSFILTAFWLVYTYNTFITYRQRCENAWRQVDVDLRMRYDLIPRLVSVVKEYMKHESQVLESLTRLRSRAVSGGRKGQIAAEQEMSGSVDKVIARVEDYPDLKAQEPMQKLVRELRAIEEKIAHGRIIYSEAVMEYNTTITRMPAGLVAAMSGFKTRPYFHIETEERAVPSVGTLNG